MTVWVLTEGDEEGHIYDTWVHATEKGAKAHLREMITRVYTYTLTEEEVLP